MPLSVSVLVQGKTLPLPSCRPGQNGSVTDYRVLGTQIVVFGCAPDDSQFTLHVSKHGVTVETEEIRLIESAEYDLEHILTPGHVYHRPFRRKDGSLVTLVLHHTEAR